MQNKNKHESGPASLRSGQGGQVFLIAVLILVIGLTVGLSVASRSVTNLKSSLEEENSQRAFAAAEAGVEKALSKSITIKKPLLFGEGNTAIKEVSVSDIGNEFLMNGGSAISVNDGSDIWLSDHTDFSSPWTGTFTIGWEKKSNCSDQPAIEVIIFSGDNIGAAASDRLALDSCSTRNNGFEAVGDSPVAIKGVTFGYSKAISISKGFIARVVPLYADSKVGVHVDSTLVGTSWPIQGKQINSTGTAGGTTRKITYYQGWPKIPNEIFQYVLFQPN